MQARSYLEQYEKIEYMIANKEKERERWEDMALGTTARLGGERVQSSGTKEKMASAVVEAVEIDRQIEILKGTLKEIVVNIEKLEPKYYNLLHKVYIQRMSLRQVAVSEGMSYSWAKNMHRKALEKLQEVLEGRFKRWR